MLNLWVLLLSLGVTARLTRLVNLDTITAPLRVRVIRRFGPQSMAAEFQRCPWCVSMWLAIPVALAARGVGFLPEVPGWFVVPALVLLLSWLTSIAASLHQ